MGAARCEDCPSHCCTVLGPATPPVCQPEQCGCGCVDPGRGAGVHSPGKRSRKRITKLGHSICCSSQRQKRVASTQAYALFLECADAQVVFSGEVSWSFPPQPAVHLRRARLPDRTLGVDVWMCVCMCVCACVCVCVGGVFAYWITSADGETHRAQVRVMAR